MPYELSEFFPLFWECPPYKELWLELREHVFQLREFRFPALDAPELLHNDEDHGDIFDIYLDLVFEALEMVQLELREDAFGLIVGLYDQEEAFRKPIESRVQLLLEGQYEKPHLGLSLLIGISELCGESIVHDFSEQLENFTKCRDISLRLLAKDILSKAGTKQNIFHKKELPASYMIALPDFETLKGGIASVSYTPGTVAYDTGDPLETVGLAREALEYIHERTEIPFRNLVERCSLLMSELVPREKWSSQAEKELQRSCRALNIETSYRRPISFVSYFALSYLIAELYDAGELNNQDLRLLDPAISVIDTTLARAMPKFDFSFPILSSIPKEYSRADWLEEAPKMHNQLVASEDDSFVLGIFLKSEQPSWEYPREFIIGGISPKGIDLSEVRDRPDTLIPGRNMALWWSADKYPYLPYLNLAMRHSLLLRGNMHQRVEIGRADWLAINPIVARDLGWTLSDQGLFQWVDSTGNIMVESHWWQSGRMGRFPYTDGIRSFGWIVLAYPEAYGQICSVLGDASWIYAVKKQSGGSRGYEERERVWCEASEIIRA